MRSSSPQIAVSHGDPAFEKREVVIVGAGLSGLIAALLLEREGESALVIDARLRPGGRILGERSAGGVHRFDLGPAWVWPPLNPRVAHWLAQLELPVFEQYSHGATLLELPNHEVRRYAGGFAQQPPPMRVAGGTTAMVDALVGRLRRSTLRLGTRLLAVRDAGQGRLALDLEHAERRSTVQTVSVITAVPPRLLASTIGWSPSLPPEHVRRWERSPTWMAGHAKFVAVYPEPFWRRQGFCGTATSHAGPLAEIHDAGDMGGHEAALFGFIGFPRRQREQVGNQELVRACVRQLERIFGPHAGRPNQTWLHDWAADNQTATAADSAPSHEHPGLLSTELPAPWRGRIHLAGSEFAPEHPGFLEGAVRSAERAVSEWRASRAGL